MNFVIKVMAVIMVWMIKIIMMCMTIDYELSDGVNYDDVDDFEHSYGDDDLLYYPICVAFSVPTWTVGYLKGLSTVFLALSNCSQRL